MLLAVCCLAIESFPYLELFDCLDILLSGCLVVCLSGVRLWCVCLNGCEKKIASRRRWLREEGASEKKVVARRRWLREEGGCEKKVVLDGIISIKVLLR